MLTASIPFQAAGEGFIAIPSFVLVQQYFIKRRPLAIALSTQGQALAAIITAPLIRTLITVYAWRGAMLLSAAVSIQGLVCAAAMRPVAATVDKNTRKTQTRQPYQEVNAAVKDPLKEKSEEQERNCNCSLTAILKPFDLSLWKSADFVLLLVSRGLSMSNLWVMHTYAVPRAVHLGIDKLQASLLQLSLGIGAIVSRFLTGVVTNLECTNRLVYYTVWQAVSGVVVMSSTLAGDHLYLFIAIYGVYGFCSGKGYGPLCPLSPYIRSKHG